MMSSEISVKDLHVSFTISKKEPGLRGALKGFVNPTRSKVSAVAGIDLEISKGELVGFIGPNGAGKTTTLKVMSGLLLPTSGSVRVFGHEPFHRENEFLKKISLVLGQKNQLLWDLPATDTFLLNKAMYSVSDASFKKILDELVELLGVQDQLSTPVRKLSLGQRMKMELIAALLHTPKVLFLDEPTIGLDVVVQRNLRDFIREYNRRHEATILLTSHYMGDVRELCSRVIVIAHGKILFDGQLNTLIAKYSPNKILRAVLENKVTKKKMQEYGEIHEWQLPNVALTVPRDQAAKRAARLMQEHSILDITIEETPIEDIIRDLFHQN